MRCTHTKFFYETKDTNHNEAESRERNTKCGEKKKKRNKKLQKEKNERKIKNKIVRVL